MAPLRSIVATLAVGSMLCCAASPNGADAQNPRIDPEIRRIASGHPDSVVVLLMRSKGPVRVEDRHALKAAGVSIGSELGLVLTGRMRAGDVTRLERLRFLAVAQLSRDIPVTSSHN